MLNHRFRRLPLIGTAVGILLVGSAGLATADASPIKVTGIHRLCVKDTGGYKAKLCLNVDATSVGSGEWRTDRITATVSERETDTSGGWYCFHFQASDLGTGSVALDEKCVQHPGTPVLTRVIPHRFLEPYPYDPGFWDRFAGKMLVKVDIDAGGYSRPEVGTATLDFN